MGPPPSSIGALAAARILTSLNNKLISPQSGSARASRIIAGARWEKATWQGPWPSSSWLSSASWLSWSVALTQRSWPCSSASITPAPLAPNSNLAASTTCCKVAARSCWGCASARLLMLATSALESIRMRLSSPGPTRPSLPLCRCPSAMFIGAYASIANPLGLPGGLPVEVPLVVVNLLAGAPSCC